MKNIFITVLLLFGLQVFGQEQETIYEKENSFYPNDDIVNKENIEWGTFTVPENWDKPQDKKVKLAVAKLKNLDNNDNAESIVVVAGGPGGGAIEIIQWWIVHPLRKTHDIILVDARGTGFSEPRLCPELGNKFLNILAKNQNSFLDEQEKVADALECKKSLIEKGIDIDSYNSVSIAKDLHALKEYFKYSKWNVYGVSYGTYITQVYATMYPSDLKTLLLDSPISDINKYYTLNTSNYVSKLKKVFKACEDDPECNSEYPDLESVYRKTILELRKKPITVKVDKNIVPAGEFTYNEEDFKIAIHQALYKKSLVEVLPLLINQFYNRNEAALSALVASFSGALSLDYGMYFCVTCNETVPRNSYKNYEQNVSSQKLLSEGVSFYKSDFAVCKEWNKGKNLILKEVDTLVQKINVPTLIFTGGFDPITPSKNGKELEGKIKNSQVVNAPSYGHASGLTGKGFDIAANFIKNPTKKVKNYFKEIKIKFVKNIYVNGGVAKVGNSLQNMDVLFFTPLVIALLVSIIAVFTYTFSLFKKRKNQAKINSGMKVLLIVSSIFSIVIILGLIIGLNNAALNNFYIIAFGLPEDYSFVFKLLIPFVSILLIISVLFLIKIKEINDRSILFTVLFSNILIATYLFYWGVF
ncbi:alpha/beta fold hydrolase [Tenacibaculum ascidiaceicola]|uniref:alpha/beta fold hydrolase n=1 Tax=Tenacibaculum ascidiaceicola TaxID=1699411 RepID=UPI003CE4AF6E